MEPDYLAPSLHGVDEDPGAWGAHDPTIVADGDRWLMFSTDTAVAGSPGVGVQIRQSDDLVGWSWFGHAFDGVPAEALDWSGAVGIWAPEVVERADGWRMYYSASSFGSRTSMIALASAPSAAGPWHHVEPVVRTEHDTDSVNAIDAAVVTDAHGTDWLLYGSFFGGLRILPLDADGRPVTPGDKGRPVVVRAASINGAVEGGHILHDEESGSYALFCSFDSLFDTYNIRVARSAEVDGAYVDARGQAMIDETEPPRQVGTVLVAGYEAPDGTVWAAPGHSSHLVDGDERFLVHHVRDGADPTRHTCHVRRLRWTRQGWPVASPVPFGGPVTGPRPELAGRWLVYELEPGAPTPLRPTSVLLPADAFAGLGEDGRGHVRLGAHAVDAVLFVEADGVAVAGLDERGVVLWAIRA